MFIRENLCLGEKRKIVFTRNHGYFLKRVTRKFLKTHKNKKKNHKNGAIFKSNDLFYFNRRQLQ